VLEYSLSRDRTWGSVVVLVKRRRIENDISPNFDPAGFSVPRSGPPRAGENGNWKCKDCGNVNYARRTECNRCKKKRDAEGSGTTGSTQ